MGGIAENIEVVDIIHKNQLTNGQCILVYSDVEGTLSYPT